VMRDGVGFQGVGLGWTDGTKAQLMTLVSTTNQASNLTVDNWNTNSSFNSSAYSGNKNELAVPIWMQIRDDGTNVFFKASTDGVNFSTLYTVAKSSGFLGASGYSNVIFFINAASAAIDTIGTLLSWTQGA
jgi:hypothetical protein